MLQMGHLQTGKSVVNIDATMMGTVISTIWEIISSSQKTVINMGEHHFLQNTQGTVHALFVNERCGKLA